MSSISLKLCGFQRDLFLIFMSNKRCHTHKKGCSHDSNSTHSRFSPSRNWSFFTASCSRISPSQTRGFSSFSYDCLYDFIIWGELLGRITEKPGSTPAGAAGETTVYMVQPGDTLWSIAKIVTPSGRDIRVTVHDLQI